MWAFDLEKRQQRFRSGELKPVPLHVDGISGVGPPGESEAANLPTKRGHGIVTSPENEGRQSVPERIASS